MDQNQIEALIDAARNIRQHAYCPYSHFPVGCALLSQDGKLFTGVNVENVSFGATNCAERSALFTAASLGYRPGFIKAIAVAGETEDFLPPCSICRQVLVEWADPETPVFLTRNDGQIKRLKLLDLAPYSFTQMN
ncbi:MULTISPECIES: cytidine deaminase [Facklamia]|uniref:Cytidine deaminase n=1 Tax=Facklamia hominis TaxID=178214 RepID=A0AAJ1V3G6_9LACT|nr:MULTISPECIES: cytidine deaminase [Facklamia]MDK7188148.1 cytidine deaminase [Facklamia hominis]OFL65895.1 cytidine deaminase [Facklamia sp. HMSC062C11]